MTCRSGLAVEIGRARAPCSVALAVELPIACSLNAQDGQQRRHEWQLLIGEALRYQALTPTGVRLVFSGTSAVGRRLGELVELERQCCAFAKWTITPEENELVLRVDGEGESASAIRDLFKH